MRRCPFDGCNNKVPDSMFACRGHWFSLTKQQKARIWKCYGEYQEGEIDVEQLRKLQREVLDEAQLRPR